MTDEILKKGKILYQDILRYQNLFEKLKQQNSVSIRIANNSLSCYELVDYIGEDDMNEIVAHIQLIIQTRLDNLKTLFEKL